MLSKCCASRHAVDLLARLDNGTYAESRPTIASINASAASMTRSLAAILSSKAPRISPIRGRSGAATADTETFRRTP
ncbi:Uncharacterised protein [Mycobacterium tuberculosis]|nr:Uncharacterised protein [Mycobacterium tuberculosis]